MTIATHPITRTDAPLSELALRTPTALERYLAGDPTMPDHLRRVVRWRALRAGLISE